MVGNFRGRAPIAWGKNSIQSRVFSIFEPRIEGRGCLKNFSRTLSYLVIDVTSWCDSRCDVVEVGRRRLARFARYHLNFFEIFKPYIVQNRLASRNLALSKSSKVRPAIELRDHLETSK